jgi:hypothetical protein
MGIIELNNFRGRRELSSHVKIGILHGLICHRGPVRFTVIRKVSHRGGS